MHGDDIHIALTQNDIWLPACPCQMKTVEVPALVKNRRLRRIQVFGFSVSHDTSAESDDPLPVIHNRKHDTVPELIIHAPFFVHLHKTGLF